VTSCWEEKSAKRPTIEQALAHLAGVAKPSNDPPDPKAVLSQWQRLGSLKPGSRGYNELLRTLIGVEGNGNVAMGFTDDNAGILINIIGEVSFCDIVSCASTTSYT
jgi:hypothetical protein